MEQEKACPDTGRSRAWDRPAGSSPSGWTARGGVPSRDALADRFVVAAKPL